MEAGSIHWKRFEKVNLINCDLTYMWVIHLRKEVTSSAVRFGQRMGSSSEPSLDPGGRGSPNTSKSGSEKDASVFALIRNKVFSAYQNIKSAAVMFASQEIVNVGSAYSKY